MANRRMVSNQVIDRDFFIELPLSAQALYFHLIAKADDDGFLDGAKRIQRNIGATDEDMQYLVNSGLVINFDGGVLVIRHWRIHNTLRADRYTPTLYQKEKKALELNDNKEYEICKDNIGIPNDNHWLPSGCQVVATSKVKLSKDNIKVLDKSNTMSDFSSPTQKNTSKKPSDIDKVVESWNELSAKGLNRVTKINPTTNRGKMLKARLKEYSLDDVLKAIDNVKQSDFLLGNNNRGWMITFDWFVKPNNFVKVLEGNYNNSKPTAEDKPVTTDHKDTKSAAMEIFGEF